jgi:hypothetical protein
VHIHLYRDDPAAAGGSTSKGTLLAVEDVDTAYEIYELVCLRGSMIQGCVHVLTYFLHPNTNITAPPARAQDG